MARFRGRFQTAIVCGLLLAVSVLSAAAGSAAASSLPGDGSLAYWSSLKAHPHGPIWPRLERRPVHVPGLREDGSCPVNQQWTRATSIGMGVPGRGLFLHGPGPVYPSMGRLHPGVLPVAFGSDPTKWARTKVVWKVSPAYSGPLLIRGHQVGGRHQVGFGGSPQHPWRELRIPFAYASGSHSAGGLMRVPTVGCYAWQFDGLGFSHTLVFRAMALPHQPMRPRPHGPVWRKLSNRQIRLPHITAGATCPVTAKDTPYHPHHVNLVPDYRLKHGKGYGAGPVFPLAADLSRFPLKARRHGIGSWYAGGLGWGIDNRYRGPVLVRGRQLDGHHQMRFQTAMPAPRRHSLRFRSPRPDRTRRSFKTEIRVPTPGCYGWQIDGRGFSHTIIFNAI
jgi:hypothetical protein